MAFLTMRWRYPHSNNVYPKVEKHTQPVFQSVSITSGPVTGTTGKTLAPDLVPPPLQVFIHINEVPMRLFQAAQTLLSQSFLTGKVVQSLEDLHDPLLAFSASISLLYWRVQNSSFPGATSPGLNDEEGSSLPIY